MTDYSTLNHTDLLKAARVLSRKYKMAKQDVGNTTTWGTFNLLDRRYKAQLAQIGPALEAHTWECIKRATAINNQMKSDLAIRRSNVGVAYERAVSSRQVLNDLRYEFGMTVLPYKFPKISLSPAVKIKIVKPTPSKCYSEATWSR